MKTRKNKLICFLLITAMLIAASTSGCKKEEIAAPDVVVSALYELVAKDDAKKMQDIFGYKSEEEAKTAFLGENFERDMLDQLKIQAEAAGASLDESVILEIYQAQMEALGKLSFSATIRSQEDETAIVVGAIGYYDQSVVQNAIEQAGVSVQEQFSEEDMETEEGVSDFMNQYMRLYAENIRQMEPAEGTKQIVVDMTKSSMEINGKSKTIWLPVNQENFSNDIFTITMQAY